LKKIAAFAKIFVPDCRSGGMFHFSIALTMSFREKRSDKFNWLPDFKFLPYCLMHILLFQEVFEI